MTLKFALAPSNTDDILYTQAGTPTLDLRFASSKSLNDNVSGQNLIDFTRGGNGVGTYTGSDRLIKNSVVNLLLRSEEFDNASWVKSAGCSVTPNSEIAPDSTLSAGRIDFSGANESMLQSISALNSTAYTISFWVKGTAGETIRIARTNMSGSFNHTLNGQWQRVTSAGTSSSTTISVGVSTFSGVTARSVYIWGAQLEQSDTVGEYVKTTSSISGAPRFDHDPETGESLGLLIEESRTNLLLQSEDFSTTWSPVNVLPFGSGSIVNNAVAPDGLTTADKITPDTTNNQHRLDQTASIAAGQQVFTVYAKADGYSFVGLRINSAGAGFNLLTGTISSFVTSTSASITPAGNGWYRCSIYENSAAANSVARINVTEDGGISTSFTGNGTSGIYIWGAQLEAGAFPTSYIPTTSTQVTRNADVASITGDNFSRWYSQSEGTVFAEITGYPITPSQFPRIFEANDGTSNNLIRVQQYNASNNNVRVSIVSGGVNQMAQDGGAILKGSQGKTALAFANNDCALVVDGGTPSVDTSVTIATNMTQSTIGATILGTSAANSTISRLTFFDRRLPNATLESITSSTAPTTYGNLILKSANTPQAIAGVAPTLDYRFARDKREIESVSLTDKLTYTGGNGTFVGSDGYIQRATTNVPRFDHDPLSRVSEGLLVEGSRENLLTYSDFSSSWLASRSEPLLLGQELTPDGSNSACLWRESTSAGSTYLYRPFTFTQGTTYTLSVFAKQYNGQSLSLNFTTSVGFPVTGSALFNLEDGTYTTPPAGFTATSSYYGNGWWRLSLTGTCQTTTTANWIAFTMGVDYADPAYGIYLWGAQLEAASTPSTYIPTTSATVTRTADSAVIDGTGVLTGTYTMVAKPEGSALVSGSNIELQEGYTTERVMVFPAALTAQQITTIREAM